MVSEAALPGWLSFDAATRTVSGRPPTEFSGRIDLKVTMSDGTLSVTDTFTLTMMPTNDAPVVAAHIAAKNMSRYAVDVSGSGTHLR